MSDLAILGGSPVRTRPFATWPVYGSAEETALLEVLHSGRWNRWEGQKTGEFEARFAEYIDINYALAVSSGTGALEAAMHGAGICYGDEVILPAYGYTMPACAVLRAGAVPVFADVDALTFNMDPGAVEEQITTRTRAIVVIHLGGLPADLDRLTELSRRHRLILIEDAALAVGSTWRGRKVGGIGELGVFSCQAEKNLNCGEGGVVVTDDRDRWMRSLAFHDYWKGMLLPQHDWEHLCSTFRITEFQAALLLSQLDRVDEQAQIRAANAGSLDARLQEIAGISPRPKSSGVTRDACSLYMFRYDARQFHGLPKSRFIAALQAEGVPAVPGYARSVSRNPIFLESDIWRARHLPQLTEAAADYRAATYPITERLCAHEAVWLRQQTLLCSPDDVNDIVDAIAKIRNAARELLSADG